MNFPAALTVPDENRAEIGCYILVVVAFASGFAASLFGHERTITRTNTVHVGAAQAVASMSAAQLLAALGTPSQVQTQGAVTCGIYKGGAIEVCHK